MTATRRAGVAILGFFAIEAAVRIALGPALFFDEAEMLLHGRHLAWGYGPQPPLYAWLQWATFQILGPGLPALVLLKLSVFASALLALLRLLARAAPDGGAAAAGTIGLGLIPVLGWEAQRIYTHSLLALLLAVLATGAVIATLRRGTWSAHLWLGLLMALGLLAKPNFAVWPPALLIAAAVLPEWRGGLRPLRLLGSLAVAAALAAWPLGWMLAHPDLAGASVGKLYANDGSGVIARATGSLDLLRAILAFGAVAALAFGGIATGRWRAVRARLATAEAPDTELARLLLVAVVAGWALVWAGVLATGATHIAEQWLIPVSWALVPGLALAVWPVATPRARRVPLALAATVWVGGLLNLPFQSYVTPGTRHDDYAALGEVLREEGGARLPLLVGRYDHAGNLLLVARDLDPDIWRGTIPDEGALLLVTPNRAETLLENDALADRLAGRRDVELERGRSSVPLVVLRLAPARD